MKKRLLLIMIILSTIFFACTTTEELTIPDQKEGTTIQTYTNKELKYTFEYPSAWILDTGGLTNSVDKNVEVYPEEASIKVPGTPTYFDIHLDDSSLLEGIFGNPLVWNRTDIEFGGQKAYKFISVEADNEVYIVVPYQGLVYVIRSNKIDTDEVKAIINSFKFI